MEARSELKPDGDISGDVCNFQVKTGAASRKSIKIVGFTICHFAENIFKCIFLNEKFWISNKFSSKCVPYGLISNKTALPQVIVWHLNRQEVITWINVVQDVWSHMSSPDHHWNKNVVILTKFSSLAALEVVILTTSSAASDEHFIKMKTFPFQWQWSNSSHLSHATCMFRYLPT